MNLGRIIYYHRKRKNMTQEQLSHGICSVTHLSKIENNMRDIHASTLELLLERLDICFEEETEQIAHLEKLLEEFYDAITKVNEIRIRKLYDELDRWREYVDYTDSIFTYKLYMIRYLLFKEDLEQAYIEMELADKYKNKLSRDERDFYEFLKAILLYKQKEYSNGTSLLNELNAKGCKIIELNFYMALMYSLQNVSSLAIHYSYKAMDDFHKSKNMIRTVHCRTIISNQLVIQKEFNKAEQILNEIIADGEILKDSSIISLACNNLGFICFKQGDFQKAEEYYQKSLSLKVGETDEYYNVVKNLAKCYFMLGKMEDGIRLLHQELERIGDTADINYINLKRQYLRYCEDEEQFMDYIENEVFPRLLEMNATLKIAKYAEELGVYYKKKDDLEKTVYYYEHCLQVYKQIHNDY